MMGRIPERVWQHLCDSISQLRMVFGLAAAMLGLMLVWYPFVEPGSATAAIVVINIIGASGFLLLTGPFIYLCGRRQARP